MGRQVLGFYLVVMAVVIILAAARKEQDKSIQIRSFTNCASQKTWAMDFVNITCQQVDRETLDMTGWIIVHEPLGPELMGLVSVSQCTDASNPDSCEYLIQDLDLGDACDLLADRDAEWARFVENIKMDFTCPVKPKSYKIDHLPVLLNRKTIPVDGDFLWRIHFSCTQDGVMKGCANLEVLTK